MGKLNKNKQKVLNLLSEHKPVKTGKTMPPSSRLTEINPWKTKPVPVILPSQTENDSFERPQGSINGITEVVTLDRPTLSILSKDEHLKSISKSVKNKLAAKKKKRLLRGPQGFKPLTTVESKSSKRDQSINRFLYFEHAEITQEHENEEWSIDNLLEATVACDQVEINKGFTIEQKPFVMTAKKTSNVEISKGVVIEPEIRCENNINNGTITAPMKSVKRKADEEGVSDTKRQKLPAPSYYVKPMENGVNVCLKKDATIYVHGFFEMQVLFGSVEVLGKRLDITSKPVKMYSSRGTAFLSIANLNRPDEAQWLQINEKLDGKSARKLNADDAIIHCKPFTTKLVSFLEDNLSQVLFPKANNNVRCLFRDYSGDDWSVFQKSEQWEGIIRRTGKDSRVMLCGGKGVGKSTLLRFIINQLLEQHEAVSVIDLDVGQAEFTIAGCISTLVIKEALLGPNYTHLRKPERCLFIPNIDITENYELYLLSIKELMRSTKLPAGCPIVVNYMGFTKGLGLSLVAAAITAVQPTLVVQIQSPSRFKNYIQDLTPENVYTNNTLLPEEIMGKAEYDLLKVDCVTNGGNVWELQPRQMREMSITSYFSDVLPTDCSYITEAGVKLYRTNLNDIKIIRNGKDCDPMAVNANIVGLCLKIKDSIYECRGWGIVKSVSKDLGDLTIITPLEESELEEVDHLILGSVSLPPSFYFRNHADLIGHIPYVYEGEMQNFAKTPKRSIVPKKAEPTN